MFFGGHFCFLAAILKFVAQILQQEKKNDAYIPKKQPCNFDAFVQPVTKSIKKASNRPRYKLRLIPRIRVCVHSSWIGKLRLQCPCFFASDSFTKLSLKSHLKLLLVLIPKVKLNTDLLKFCFV